MSRVLSLSLANTLYDKAHEYAVSEGLTVYQYVRRAVEKSVAEDEHIAEMLTHYDHE